jgi:hypothetical protein
MTNPTAHPAASVLEDQTDEKFRDLYEDIKSTLRVPFVGPVFRRLAAGFPRYVELAWRQLQPNAHTVYFERASDDLRALAATGMAKLGASPTGSDEPEIGGIIQLYHYANPKYLLAVAAIRAATNGQAPRLQVLPLQERRQIKSGIPPEVAAPALIDAETVDDRVRSLLDELQSAFGGSEPGPEYLALARWPEYLETACRSLQAAMKTSDYALLQRDLHRMADQAVTALPFRLELSPHTLRHAGISELDLDAIRAILNQFYAVLQKQALNVALLSVGCSGRDGATRSPFPADVK